ncbi:hypothetical protein Tco_0217611 [Tanacetum coccineum]
MTPPDPTKLQEGSEGRLITKLQEGSEGRLMTPQEVNAIRCQQASIHVWRKGIKINARHLIIKELHEGVVKDLQVAKFAATCFYVQLNEQAVAVTLAARAEISAALNQMKKETAAEVDAKLAERRKKVEAELQEVLLNLEKQKEDTIKSLDSRIVALSQEIVNKVLPVQ